MTLDRRTNAFRADLAHGRLRDLVVAERYVDGEPARIGVPVADLRPRPELSTGIDTQMLMGEPVTVLDRSNGWAWVQGQVDQYVGYLREDLLAPTGAPPTHMVSATRTFVYSEPDMKRPVVHALSMASRIAIAGEAETRGTRYLLLAGGGAVVADHVIPIGTTLSDDPVSVAGLFLETPYLWGGRSGFGIDCSGLVQMSLMMCGKSAPRDSDMQADGLGDKIEHHARRRGDLVFWQGHAAMLADADTIIHASGKTMRVCRENLTAAIDRIRPLYGEPTIWRRVG